MSNNIRYKTGELDLLKDQSETTAVFTATNATNLLNDTAHGLSNGDCITVKTGTTLPTGLSADLYYYVISSLANTFQVALTPGGSAVTFSDDGTGTHTWSTETAGHAINVSLYRHLVISIDADSSPDVTLKVVGSISDAVPTFINPQSSSNRYEYINLIDHEDAAAIAGDTGIVLAAEAHRQIVINTDGLEWVAIKTLSYFGGDLNVKLKGFSG